MGHKDGNVHTNTGGAWLLSAKDFKDPNRLNKLAELSGRTVEEFEKDFKYLVHEDAH
jgi:hypothetical protein